MNYTKLISSLITGLSLSLILWMLIVIFFGFTSNIYLDINAIGSATIYWFNATILAFLTYYLDFTWSK